MKRLGLFLIFLVSLLSMSVAQAEKTIKIGYTNWADNLTTTHIAKYIIDHRMGGVEADLVNANVAAIYQGVANGDIDAFMEASLPVTHEDYYKKYSSQIISVGEAYPRLRQGFVVPDYVPKSKVNSIEDLKSGEVKEKFGGRIVGIDPGSGLMRKARASMDEDGLEDFGYTLESSSGPGMTSALKSAIDKKEWILVTGWEPHWMWARWDLRFIADKPGPKALYQNYDTTTTIVNKNFIHKSPKVYDLFNRITVPMDELQQAIYNAQDSSYAEAAEKYVKDHPKRVDFWISGEMPD